MKILLACVFFTQFIGASPAHAGFVNNRNEWEKLSVQQKLAYSEGIIDTIIIWHPSSKFVFDMENCLIDLNFRSSNISDLIEEKYRLLTNWELSPVNVAYMGIREVCLAHMNRARAARGDELLE